MAFTRRQLLEIATEYVDRWLAEHEWYRNEPRKGYADEYEAASVLLESLLAERDSLREGTMLTTEQLRDLIASDDTARELANRADDAALAKRLSEIAPPVYRECRLSRLGLLSLYDNPQDGMTVLATIDAIKQANPIVAEIARYMEPGVDAAMLPDFGLPAIRAALTAPVEAGGLGLSPELAEPILRAGQQQPTITPEMAGAAR